MSQLREADETSGSEYLDFACCYSGLLGVFRRYITGAVRRVHG